MVIFFVLVGVRVVSRVKLYFGIFPFLTIILLAANSFSVNIEVF